MLRPLVFAALLLLAAPVLAQAPAPGPLKLSLSQSLVQTVRQDGRNTERLTPNPVGVQPGDILAQELTVTNTSDSAQRNVTPTVPVPAGTRYHGGATTLPGVRTEFSFDGGRTFGAAPLIRRVTVTENGRSVTKDVVVPPAEYTHVRWVIPTLEPGTPQNFRFRVKVV